MKKKLLFSLIGAIVLFLWQFLSFALINLHQPAMEYTSTQNEILQKLEDVGLQEGMYFLGQPDPSLSRAEQEEVMKEYDGRPWATINYHKSMSMDMVMPMIRGFIVDLIIAFFLFWLFLQQKDATLVNRILLSLCIGMITFLAVPYTNYIWFMEPDIWAYMLDGIVPWLILGLIGYKMAK